jgi:hypothetical protein
MKLRIVLHSVIITIITKNHSGENGAKGREIPERSDEIPWRYTWVYITPNSTWPKRGGGIHKIGPKKGHAKATMQ